MTTLHGGFTLLELLLAISLMAVVTTVTYLCFSTITVAWRRGMTLVDELHHGDFVMEQLVMGLRSAYYPDARQAAGTYGFWQKDNGDGPYSSDEISWVKLGGALVGKDCPFMGSPHRVVFRIQPGEGEDEWNAAFKAWRVIGQTEEFDPDDLEFCPISREIVGFNCRAAYKKVEGSDDIDWLDEWKETNRVPSVVELTLYLTPLGEGEEPVEVKRIIGIPVAPLAWR